MSGKSPNAERRRFKTWYGFIKYFPGSSLAEALGLLVLFCVFLTALPCAEARAADEVLSVKRIVIRGLSSCSRSELLSLMDIRAGSIDRATIDDGIKRAFRKGIFEDIAVEYGPDQTILIRVREREYVDKVIVSGNRYFSSGEIRKRFMFKEGDLMRYDLVDKAKKELEDSLGLSGFPDAKVSLSVEKTQRPYRVRIRLRLREGAPLVIKEVDIVGADAWLRQRMYIEPGDIYNVEEIKKNLGKIREYLKSKGYLNPAVGPFTFSEGLLTVLIHPGKKLKISINGNENVSTSKILRIMPFREAEEVTDELIEEVSAKILSLYHEKGFIYAQVAPLKSEDANTISITFFIYEGKSYEVRSIRFENASISEKTLKSVINLQEKAPYNPDLLDSDAEILTGLYRALGYLNAEVVDRIVDIDEEEADVSIIFVLSEGKRFIVSEIAFEGNRFFTDQEVRDVLMLEKDAPYNEIDIIDAKKRLTDSYKEHGFTDVNVSVDTRLSGQSVKVIFRITEGEKEYFGKTIIRGNRFTRTEVIQRELIHKEGEPFNYKVLLEGTKRLYRLGLFKDIDIKLLDRKDHKRDIVITVSERKPGVIEFSFGYEDYEGMRGSIDISYRNLWGMNRRIHLRGELSTLKERFVLGYNEPYLFGKAVVFNAFLLNESRTEKSIDTGEVRYRMKKKSSGISIEKNLTRNMKAQIAYDFSLVKTFDLKPDVVLSREDEGTIAISGIRPGILYDSRDNPFDPSRGILIGASLKIASTYLLGETDFVKLTVHGSGYKRLGRRLILALSLKGGAAQGFADTRELPIVERFFLGGRNTVRGFEQDTLGPKGIDGTPTGGNAFLMSNVELRAYVGRGFSLVGFVDGGNVWRRTVNMDLTLRYTAGLGIRYRTPAGPIRIDYGYKLDRKEDESAGEVHFSIGHAF
ncbi:MAG: outer membrane protein assembly factor BamA [Nitrospirae bacterium]|nr:outer membrane protein assembly factor BamA [Nitrospirota bacterium]